MSRTLLGVAALALCAAPLAAQSTLTEKQAAAPVLRSIDALEARLQPTKLAERLAGARDPSRDRMLERVGSAWIFAASLTALAVHFGMVYGHVTHYANNPAVPATLAIFASLAVALAGFALSPQPAPAPAPIPQARTSPAQTVPAGAAR